MKKRIHINGRFLTQDITGVQKFAWAVCQELQYLGWDIQLICPKNIKHQLPFGTIIETGMLQGHKWEQIELPLYLKQNNIPPLLNLCNTAPLVYRNNIITLHDLAFIENPNWFNPKFAKWYKWLIPKIAKKSKHILTVSEFSKSEIMKHLHVLQSKITVLPNGIYWNANAESLAKTRNRPYILSVGSDNPRKNYQTLIESFKNLDKNDYDLIIVGKPSTVFNSNNPVNAKNVYWLNKVNDAELIHLYKNATAFVSTSLYEGFGIPALEAISLNCPIILNDIPVYRELYQDLAQFYDGSKDSLTKELNSLLGSPKQEVYGDDLLKSYNYKQAALGIESLLINL